MEEQTTKTDEKKVDQEKLLKDFSSKFIATIGSEGTIDGCLASEAMKKFDEDWPRQKHEYYVKELGCKGYMELLRKMDENKIRIYIDAQQRWHVVVKRSETNKAVLDHIDSAIRRQRCGMRKGRSENIIPLGPKTNLAFEKYKRGEISYAEASAIASASGDNRRLPPMLSGANATPIAPNFHRSMDKAGTRMFKKQLDSIKTENTFENNEQDKKLMASSSGSNGMASIFGNVNKKLMASSSGSNGMASLFGNVNKKLMATSSGSNGMASLFGNVNKKLTASSSGSKAPLFGKVNKKLTASSSGSKAPLFGNVNKKLTASSSGNNGMTSLFGDVNKNLTASASGNNGMTSLFGDVNKKLMASLNGSIDEALAAPIEDDDF